MKICLAFLSVGNNIFAGIENSLLNLALGFQQLNIDVVFYSSFLSGSDDWLGPFPVWRSEILPRELPAGDETIHQNLQSNRYALQEEFAAFVQREKIDCAITFDALWGILQVAEISANPPCPCIMSFHVPNTPALLQQAAQAPYLFRRTVSPVLKEQIEAVCPQERVVIIPDSFDCRAFSPKNNAGLTSRVIFCNARIDIAKGIPDLITAFAAFREKHSGYELWLCGGDFPFGDKKQAMQITTAAINFYNLSAHVKWLPNLAWPEVADIIRQAAVVALPTHYESFGRAALETLGCGVPLVATRAGNLPHLVGNAGLLVEPRSAPSLCEALCTLVEQPDLYHRFEVEGPLVAAQYDNSIIAQQFLDAIRAYSA